jgi:hypothetical protein
MSKDHTVQTIVTALNETDDRPRSQIAAIVQALGEEAALAVLVEANAIERNGGMMLPDQSRRRTPGGVFFALARKRLSPEDREAIFPKTVPAKKDGEKEEEPRAGRPDRRHVRLIRPAEPPRAPSDGAAQLELAGVRNNGAHAPQPPAQQAANGADTKQEVKLVRLDRRRIVSLPPPKPEPVPASPAKSESRAARSVARAAPSSAREAPAAAAPETKYPEPPGLDLAYQRLEAKKLVMSAVADLPLDQRRVVLLDVLAEITEDRSLFTAVSEQAPELRGRILAAVGNRLGIPLGQLATTIYGADTPSNRRRVKSITGEPED